MALSHSGIELLTLISLIKKLIEKLRIDNEKLKFVSIYIAYEYNNESIVMETSPSMTPTPKHIPVKYHWFSQNVCKEFLIYKIESEK